MTYDEMIDEWSSERMLMGEVEEYTVEKQVQRMRKYSKYLGGMQASDIRPRDVNAATLGLRQGTSKRGRPYSATYMHELHKAGWQLFKWAVENDYAAANPFKKTSRPRAGRPPRKYLTREQATEEYEYAKEEAAWLFDAGDFDYSNYASAVVLAIQTGMRRGEILALDWGHVDLDRCIVHVARSMKATSSCTDTVIGDPKTASSVRDVYIGPDIAGHLRWMKGWEYDLYAREFSAQVLGAPVFCNLIGGYTTTNIFEHWWTGYRQTRPNLHGVRFHDLRHTHATLLISSGVDVKTVQTRLGHSNASMTLNVYTHAVPENEAKAAKVVDDMLSRRCP